MEAETLIATHLADGRDAWNAEIDQGLALLCCSKPLTDLVVDR
ncbi:MAG: hypothetical protein AB7I59_22065 [Geminicoccaceae bacterium]